jgi:glycosyltransferase involved in cell wall biosynthesis
VCGYPILHFFDSTRYSRMKIAFITRSTLLSVPGGDTVQVTQTAKQLRNIGFSVDLFRAGERVDETAYDIFHFFNITRPADIISYTTRLKKPYFISPLFIDYSEYDKMHRKGISGWVLRNFTAQQNEYIKTVGRWIKGKDRLVSKQFLWRGQRKSIAGILSKSKALLPNSLAELKAIESNFGAIKSYTVVPNGIDTSIFNYDSKIEKDLKLVVCAARIEGIKNQTNLVKAINHTSYTLQLAGTSAPNQMNYYNECRSLAGPNIIFDGQLIVQDLMERYKKAKVHVLPSWFETCGLSSLEAAAMGCNIVISDRGYARDYFGEDAFYCDPNDPVSIRDAIDKASLAPFNENLVKKIREKFTWQEAARITAEAYQKYASR